MRKIFLALISFLFTTALFAQASQLVVVNVKEMFVPNGFDDNDEALVVNDGYLPDSCHRVAYTETTFDRPTSTFQVIQYARRYQVPCLPALVPYFTEAKLGVVPEGRYTLQSQGAAEEVMEVTEAQNQGPDDHLYAPVDAARVEYVRPENKYYGIIQGRFTNTCMNIDEVRVIDSGRTKEVLPIMTVDNGPDCENREIPFSWMVELPAEVAEGRRLLHVRSLNGQSLNMMYTVYEQR